MANKRKRPGHELGSYQGYYQYRRDTIQTTDSRLLYLDGRIRSRILEKNWLDIGCNEGLLTIALARTFNCQSMIGLDIDSDLINKANHNLEMSRPEDHCKEIKFIQSDIVSPIEPRNYHSQFGVISCFSVSKWIHLNYGDEGVQLLFKRIHDYLAPDGIFILEPQPWRSYRKRRHLTQRIAEQFRTLKLRPDDFDGEITALGFALILSCKSVEAKTLGFRRPIKVFQKMNKS